MSENEADAATIWSEWGFSPREPRMQQWQEALRWHEHGLGEQEGLAAIAADFRDAGYDPQEAAKAWTDPSRPDDLADQVLEDADAYRGCVLTSTQVSEVSRVARARGVSAREVVERWLPLKLRHEHLVLALSVGLTSEEARSADAQDRWQEVATLAALRQGSQP